MTDENKTEAARRLGILLINDSYLTEGERNNDAYDTLICLAVLGKDLDEFIEENKPMHHIADWQYLRQKEDDIYDDYILYDIQEPDPFGKMLGYYG